MVETLAGLRATTFLVSGAGGKLGDLDHPDLNPAWWQRGDALGFWRVTVDEDTFTATAYDVSAETLFEHSIER